MRTLAAIALGLMLAMGASGALAEDDMPMPPTPAPDAAGQNMATPEMAAGMQAMRDHSKMMDGITDPKKLDTEMKKHMRMMDDMMESMMMGHGAATTAAPSPTAPMGKMPMGKMH